MSADLVLKCTSLCFCLVFGSLAQASSQFKDQVADFGSGHSLGMGGTSVSFSKGLDAMFENPAGISQSKYVLSEAVLASPMVTLGEEGRELYEDINKGTDALEVIQKYANKPQHASVQNVTGIAFKRAAIGFLQRGQVDLMAGSDPISGVPTAELRAVARAGIYMASSRSFFDDWLMLGFTTKLVQKRELNFSKNVFEVEKELKGKSTKALLKENMSQGMALGADLGAIFRVKDMDTKPALGVVVRNIAMNYNMAVANDKPAPSKDPVTYDIGLSLEPGTRKSISRIAIDIKDASNVQKMSLYRRIHLGGELSFQETIGFTAGIGQGYPSYGAYINIKVFKIEAGLFGTEMGKQAGDLGSRRYFGRFSVGWLE